MDLKLMPGAEPFYFPGGKVGCLCLHGLSASPQEMIWLGQHLAAQGISVCGPRMYAHGITHEHFFRMRWQDWYLSALDGYHILRRNCDQVVVCGFSMGGLAALLMASLEDVAAAVVIATPLYLPQRTAHLSHVLRRFVPWAARYDQTTDRIDQRVRQLQQERGEPITGRVAYYAQSMVGVSELLKFQSEVKAHLSEIECPVLAIYSEKDDTALIYNIDLLQRGLTGSQDFQTLRLTESEHIYTNDVEFEQVFETAYRFIVNTTQL
jgi:carboxylesterase